MSATVNDVMTTRVAAVRKNAPFKDIATLLTRYRVSAFPVLDDDGKVIGVVSEADLLCKEALIAAMGGRPAPPGPHHDDFARAAAVTAADLMTTPAVTITPGEPVTGAARLMYNARVKRLPVVSENGHLVGIISRADVLSVYSRPDGEIGEEITKNVILHEFLNGPGCFTVTVKDGIVTLEGRPEPFSKVGTSWPRYGESKGSYRCATASPTRKECNPMNPNSALSVWQLTVIAVVPVAALAVWLIAIFLAAREPRGRTQEVASRTGTAVAGTGAMPAAVAGEGSRSSLLTAGLPHSRATATPARGCDLA